jgi:hypothetical protein
MAAEPITAAAILSAAKTTLKVREFIEGGAWHATLKEIAEIHGEAAVCAWPS